MDHSIGQTVGNDANNGDATGWSKLYGLNGGWVIRVSIWMNEWFINSFIAFLGMHNDIKFVYQINCRAPFPLILLFETTII